MPRSACQLLSPPFPAPCSYPYRQIENDRKGALRKIIFLQDSELNQIMDIHPHCQAIFRGNIPLQPDRASILEPLATQFFQQTFFPIFWMPWCGLGLFVIFVHLADSFITHSRMPILSFTLPVHSSTFPGTYHPGFEDHDERHSPKTYPSYRHDLGRTTLLEEYFPA